MDVGSDADASVQPILGHLKHFGILAKLFTNTAKTPAQLLARPHPAFVVNLSLFLAGRDPGDASSGMRIEEFTLLSRESKYAYMQGVIDAVGAVAGTTIKCDPAAVLGGLETDSTRKFILALLEAARACRRVEGANRRQQEQGRSPASNARRPSLTAKAAGLIRPGSSPGTRAKAKAAKQPSVARQSPMFTKAGPLPSISAAPSSDASPVLSGKAAWTTPEADPVLLKPSPPEGAAPSEGRPDVIHKEAEQRKELSHQERDDNGALKHLDDDHHDHLSDSDDEVRFETSTQTYWWLDRGWIENSTMAQFLDKQGRFICSVDGSDVSLLGLRMCCDWLMLAKRGTHITCLHVYDISKEYLPPKFRKDYLATTLESYLVSSFVPSRYEIDMQDKKGKNTKAHLEQVCSEMCSSDFFVMGFYGTKGRKKAHMIGSTAHHIIAHAPQSVIIVQPDCPVPRGRPARFLVCIDNNQASVKALLDALTLSGDHDVITLVHVVSDVHNPNSKAKMLRSKYNFLLKGSVLGRRTGGRIITFDFLLRPNFDKSIAETITDEAERRKVDMICIGSVNARSGMINSVATEVVILAECATCISHFKNVNHAAYIERRRLELRHTENEVVVARPGTALG
mmetsp:Transcript_76225/g.203811  ORF Transcript_76225/g.203811 Transcript_76225/m.203811 type:complete len:625 (+) Transcript_76225:35-1909(+)